ncbi:MAG TPA: hypothetical protein VF017_22830 [Thermoanaerobaculia bacterium]|nr:hypothetical protein [Thermoanaerobaculia bacterium]
MPDILNDDPLSFAVALADLTNVDSPDFAFHNDAREALRALNQLAFADRAPLGLTQRSVVEDGALDDGVTDNLAAFQATVDTVAAAGGGIALVPATTAGFLWVGTLTIPPNVILRGLGDRSVVLGRPDRGSPAIRFGAGIHRGGLESLVLLGDEVAPPPIGVDLTGAHFLRLRNFQVWDFQLGLRMSDGVTSFAGYNHVSDFEINRCHVGVRAWLHCNQASIREGRIFFCRNAGAGIGLDIDSAEALTVAHIAVENFDLGVRVSGRTSVSLRDIYYEADPPDNPFIAGLWMDVRPDRGSIVRMENSIANVSRSLVMGGSLEDAVTNDLRSFVFDGAKRHHAAAPERNLLENGDFHRADGPLIPGWGTNFAPLVAENPDDFVTAGRSYDVTQVENANDGLTTSFTVPETTDYVTVMVRFKNVSSQSPLFRVASGANAALFADPLPPSEQEWRVAAITVAVDPLAAGLVLVTLTADQGEAGGQIRIDEVWAVVGATAAPPRAHAHRIEVLPEPFTVVTRAGLTTDTQFGPTNLIGLPGLGGAPRGVIGAILALRGVTSPSGGGGGLLDPSGIGATLPRAVRPFLEEPSSGRRWSLDLVYDRLRHDREVVLRGTTFVDGISVFAGSRTTSYQVDVVGWILPS